MVDPDPIREVSNQTCSTAPPTIAMIRIPEPSPVSGPRRILHRQH